MQSRIILFADEGKILTNGEAFGTQVFLGENDKAENWREITEAEHNKIIESQEVSDNE